MTQARKAAIAAYKEKKPQAGLYAIRCTPSGDAWVGRSHRLDAQANAFSFLMRHGGFTAPDLRAAHTRHGPAAFTFEVLEAAPLDLSPLGLADFLKRRLAHWRQVLGAGAI